MLANCTRQEVPRSRILLSLSAHFTHSCSDVGCSVFACNCANIYADVQDRKNKAGEVGFTRQITYTGEELYEVVTMIARKLTELVSSEILVTIDSQTNGYLTAWINRIYYKMHTQVH